MTLAMLDFEERHDRRFAFLTLNRPERANALIPSLLDEVNVAIRHAAANRVSALVLRGNGRFFSSGGDVAAFYEASRGDIRAYAGHVVGSLQKAIIALLEFPAPVITRVQGGVTGGSAGFVLAADLVAFDQDAFMQPYYSEVGFAPDGGWTALFADRVGAARANSIQMLNHRIAAADALQLGLADQLSPEPELNGVIDLWLAEIASKSAETLRATRRLIWDEARIAAVAHRLEAERQAFIDLVASPQTHLRMERFIRRD